MKDLKELNKEIRNGNLTGVFKCVEIGEPMDDITFTDAIMKYMFLAGSFVGGADPDGIPIRNTQCTVCLGHWSWSRMVHGFLLIEFVTSDSKTVAGAVGGICRKCWGHQKELGMALKRDFGIEPSQMKRVMHTGGHA